MTSLVRSELIEDGRVLHLVLDAPKGNVLSTPMLEALGTALAEHRDDARLKLVLLEGAGSSFSFGASVEEHVKARAPAMLAAFHTLVRTVAAHPIPVAALVNGACLGGAFELVCVCHFVFCTQTAKLGCPEVKLGVFPPVLAAVGPLRFGHARSERLLLTGATLDAEEAQRIGLSIRTVSGADEVLDWYRTELAPLSAFTLRQATCAARKAGGLLDALGVKLDAAERQYLAELMDGHDANEGIASFLEKRAPRWEDR